MSASAHTLHTFTIVHKAILPAVPFRGALRGGSRGAPVTSTGTQQLPQVEQLPPVDVTPVVRDSAGVPLDATNYTDYTPHPADPETDGPYASSPGAGVGRTRGAPPASSPGSDSWSGCGGRMWERRGGKQGNGVLGCNRNQKGSVEQ